jgi:hypothetical protein
MFKWFAEHYLIGKITFLSYFLSFKLDSRVRNVRKVSALLFNRKFCYANPTICFLMKLCTPRRDLRLF